MRPTKLNLDPARKNYNSPSIQDDLGVVWSVQLLEGVQSIPKRETWCQGKPLDGSCGL